MAKAIHTGILRDIVKDQAAVGEHWIPLSTLVRRIGLDEPLKQMRSLIGDALEAIQRGEDDWAVTQLEFVEGLLRPMLDR